MRVELQDFPTRPAVVLDPPPTLVETPTVPYRPRRAAWKPWSYRCLTATILIAAVIGPAAGFISAKLFPQQHVAQAPCCASSTPHPPSVTITTTVPAAVAVAAEPQKATTPPPVVRHRAPATTTATVTPSSAVTTPNVPPSSAPQPSTPPSKPPLLQVG